MQAILDHVSHSQPSLFLDNSCGFVLAPRSWAARRQVPWWGKDLEQGAKPCSAHRDVLAPSSRQGKQR